MLVMRVSGPWKLQSPDKRGPQPSDSGLPSPPAGKSIGPAGLVSQNVVGDSDIGKTDI
jgi:hypothetical protein